MQVLVLQGIGAWGVLDSPALRPADAQAQVDLRLRPADAMSAVR